VAKGTPKKPQPPAVVYERYTLRAELAGWAIVLGLAVELGTLIAAGRPLSELIPQAIADLLIGGGVAFELLFGRKARIAGDSAQAEANARAVEAELETQRLRKQFAWRLLPPDKMAEMATALRGAAGSLIIISYVHSDPESQYFARQIAAAFSAAEWRIGLQGGTYGNLWFGIIVPPAELGTAVAIASIVRALTVAGLGFNIAPIPRWTSAVVQGEPGVDGATLLFIGSKQPIIDNPIANAAAAARE
jgi:hypothetical protein